MTKRFLTPLSTDHIDFNLTNPSTDAEGRLRWNSAEGTLNLGMGNGVVQQIGEELFVTKVLNNSGVIIPNGSFVMATGAQGDQITIAKAVTNGTIDPMYMLGVATSQIGIGIDNGRVTMNGLVRDMDTSAWTAGTVLYPNPAVSGGFTSTKPDAPNLRTPIAIVVRQHATTGRIYVRMTNGSTLGGTDSNVKFGTLATNDIIVYNTTGAVWENKPLLDSIKAIDGTGSGVDADLLDGQHGSYYYAASNPNGYTANTGTVTSIGVSVPTGLSISGTPVTASGTIAISLSSGYEIPTTSALAAKAPLDSPTFTGIPAAPTAASGTNTTQIATTAFVQSAVNSTVINTQTASYTLVLADAGDVVEMNVATANNLTVPLNSAVAYPIGTSIDIVQYGAGQTTIVPTSGVTIRSNGSKLKLTGQYSAATLYKRGTDEWVIMGDLSA